MNPQQTPAERLIHQAFTTLMLNHPWYSIGLRLRLEADADPKRTPTTKVNGSVLRYNPEYIAGLPPAEVQGTLAQSVVKCSLGHPWRKGSRSDKRWNEACDYAVNPMIEADGLTIPDAPTKTVPPEYAGKSAEQIYASLPEEEEGDDQNGSQPGSSEVEAPGQGTGDGEGDDEQDGEQEGDATEAEWQEMAAMQAMLSQKAGKMGANVLRAIQDARKTRTPWQTLLREWITKIDPKDYDWSRPDRRFVGQGIYLPGTRKESTGGIAVLVDTSGSVDEEMLAEFSREITAIMQETEPEFIDVVYVDTDERGSETFTPADGEVTLNARGGGGTRFEPALEWLKNQREEEGKTYLGAMYLTDLYGSTHDLEEPEGIPFLWCVTEGSNETGPFGETIRFERDY